MRKISEIYKEYKILPNLQEHQLRVAAVAMQICDSLDIELHKKDIATACLLHDMGNIIKFDLTQTQVMHGISDSYMENVRKIQNEYFEKYGKNPDIATIAIMLELGASPEIFDIVNMVGYSNIENAYGSKKFSQKICTYSDFRVGPHGVLSLTGRMDDGVKRYANKISKTSKEDRDRQRQFVYSVEKQIFSHSKIKPKEITDESIKPYMEKLRSFEI